MSYRSAAMQKIEQRTIWGVAAITIACLFLLLVVATGRWIYRVVHPEKGKIVSLVEQLQADIDKINQDQLTKYRNNQGHGAVAEWQIDDADVELSFTSKESSTTESKTELVSASGEVGTEQGNKLTIHLHRLSSASATSTTVSTLPQESDSSRVRR